MTKYHKFYCTNKSIFQNKSSNYGYKKYGEYNTSKQCLLVSGHCVPLHPQKQLCNSLLSVEQDGPPLQWCLTLRGGGGGGRRGAGWLWLLLQVCVIIGIIYKLRGYSHLKWNCGKIQ